jgi:hypothetical protein
VAGLERSNVAAIVAIPSTAPSPVHVIVLVLSVFQSLKGPSFKGIGAYSNVVASVRVSIAGAWLE